MQCTIYTSVKRNILTEKQILAIIEITLRHLKKGRVILSVHSIGDTRMRRLNATYRKKDKTTDVLSFSTREGVVIDHHDARNEEWGDIFISVPQIYRQARSFGVLPQEEAARMLIHGVLHLAGYDHITKKEAAVMLPLQEILLVKWLRTT